MVNCLTAIVHSVYGYARSIKPLLPLLTARPAIVLGAVLTSFIAASAAAEDIEIYLGQSYATQSGSGSGDAVSASPLPGSAYLQNHQYGNYVTERGVGHSSAIIDADLVNNHKVSYEYFRGTWNWMPTHHFQLGDSVRAGTLSQLDLSLPRDDSRFGVFYNAVLTVPADGLYTFYLNSVDGSQLYISNMLVVDNNGVHPLQERSASTWLSAGDHNITVNYFNRNGSAQLDVEWSSAALDRQSINHHLAPLPNYNAVSYEEYRGRWYSLPNFNAMTPFTTGKTHKFTFAPIDRRTHFGIRYTARLNVPEDGIYSFRLGSDDGSKLWIDGNLVINNDGVHALRWRTRSIALSAGVHDLEVWFFDRYAIQFISVRWAGPGIGNSTGQNVNTGTGHDVAPWLVAGPSETKVTIDNVRDSPSFLHENATLGLDAATPEYWELHHVGETDEGETIVNIIAADSRKMLQADATGVRAVAPGSGDEFLWILILQSDGNYTLANKSSGEFLDSYRGVPITRTGPRGSQKWRLSPAQVDQTPNLVSHQLPRDWRFDTVGQSVAGNPIVRIRSKASLQYAASDSTNAYPQASLGNNDLWELIFQDHNLYRIRNVANGRYMRATGAPNGSNVGMLDGNANLGDDALWRIVPTSVSGNPPPPPDPALPNILFVLDASVSMLATDSGQEGSRIARLLQGLQSVMDNIEGVNVGLMRFSNDFAGGAITYPVAPVDQARHDIEAIINTTTIPSGATPTVGALSEAARYFRGERVNYGTQRSAFGRVSHPQSYTGGTLYRPPNCSDDNPNSRDCEDERINGNPVYTSPIVGECQANHIVLLTDGVPAFSLRNDVEPMIGDTCEVASIAAGTCGEELAHFLRNEDQKTDVDGDNTITTHTIGFNLDAQWLKELAAAGGGQYFTANSALDLLSVVQTIVNDAKQGENTIVAPAATLDMNSRLAHRDDIYLALFEPSHSAAWRGNLKRYFFDGDIKDNSSPRKVAIDPDTGTFIDDAQSYWSATPDGAKVGLGGAASRLNKNARKVTTYFPGNSRSLFNGLNALNSYNVRSADLALPDEHLGLTENDKETLLSWAAGVDVTDIDEDGQTDDTRHYIGDPLHSTPALLTYDWTGTEDDSVVFFGTNEGYIHAIDTSSGDELFSFIPEALLPNLKHRYADTPGAAKVYGMDGPITLWRNDVNRDRAINNGDHAYLYAGMRRGGNHYYALDVTDKADPRYKWHIDGGNGDFAELGQTWSKPELARIIHPANGNPVDVLIFGGGYDPQQDTVAVRTEDTIGRAIYIVDAETRALIWRGGPDIQANERFTDMRYSIPSDVKIVDLNGDNLIDQMYVGDMGGQLWRFDIDNRASHSSDLVSGGVIANLADETPQGNRRFYNAPDLSLVNQHGQPVLMVSIGSGYRAHPLDKIIEDRFYVIQQPDFLNGAPAGYGIADGGAYRPVTEADLYDVTDNRIGQGDLSEQQAGKSALEQASGWYLAFGAPGEKSLSSSITVNSQLIFTTYSPERGSNPCAPDIGIGRIYVLNILDGTPTLNLAGDPDTPKTADDRSAQLMRPGIPPPPRVLFPEGDTPQLLIGPEKGPELDLGPLIKRVSWSEQP